MKSRSSVPRLTVLGLYRPAANIAEYEAFVERQIAERDPANYSNATIELFSHFKRKIRPPHTEADRLEIWEEFENSLAQAALVEVLVEDADSKFDAGNFVQPDPKAPLGWSQYAWQETYLSEDGKTVLSGYPSPQVPVLPRFRVVFYIHAWRRRLGLLSTYGALQLPRQRPMPKRLWELVPYEAPD